MNFTTAAAALALAAIVTPVAQSQTTSLAGAWKATEVVITGPGGRTITNLRNLTLFTAKYFARVEDRAEGPRSLLADPATATADDLRAAWGPFFAEAGTYEIAGGELTMRPTVSKNAAAMNGSAYTVYAFTLTGNTVTLTAKRNQAGPLPNPATIKATRIE
jgi:hypothetical protein